MALILIGNGKPRSGEAGGERCVARGERSRVYEAHRTRRLDRART
jgi:hypothetical protein